MAKYMSKHAKLCEDATDAIDAVNSDTSVSPGTTRTSLLELAEHINMLITVLAENDDGSDEHD